MVNVLLSITLGALLGGVVRAFVDTYLQARESKGIALALAAEVRALRQLIEARDIPAQVQRTIRKLEGDAPIEARDLFGLRVTHDYFAVFRAVTHRIGLLGDLSADLVVFYNLSKAVVEEIAEMRERRDRFTDVRIPVEQRTSFDRAELLDRARELHQLLLLSVSLSERLLAGLEEFRERRWLGLAR